MHKQSRQRRSDHALSYSLAEWCEAEGICLAMFYKLRKQGKAPATYNVGSRVRISADADAEWRRQRETEAAASGA